MKNVIRLRFAAVAATGALFVACGGDGADSAATPQDCSTPAPVSGAKLDILPPKLPFEKWGTIIKVTERSGFVGAELISKLTIVELYPEISRAIQNGGYQTISGENEGFEAELFFQKGPNTGTFLLREGPCKGDVTVKLIYGAAKGAGR